MRTRAAEDLVSETRVPWLFPRVALRLTPGRLILRIGKGGARCNVLDMSSLNRYAFDCVSLMARMSTVGDAASSMNSPYMYAGAKCVCTQPPFRRQGVNVN